MKHRVHAVGQTEDRLRIPQTPRNARQSPFCAFGIYWPTMMSSSIFAAILFAGLAAAQQPKLYNTAKQKLLEGKQVFSFTQSKADPAAYCEAAKHYDYT